MKKAMMLFLGLLLFVAVGCSNSDNTKTTDAKAGGSEQETSDYPVKPIKLIVPFAPGGNTDSLARAIAKEMPEYLPNKQEVAVINKDGAGTTLGLTELAKSDNDGYTFGITTSSGLDIQPHYGDTAYDINDFDPIIKVAEISTALVVMDDSPIKDYDDWLNYVKENPGKFTYAAPGGTGSSGHIVMEQLSKELGIEIEQIPYEGTADIKKGIMSGEIDAGLLGPDIDQGGDLRPIFFNTNSKGPTDFYEDIPNTEDLDIDARSNFYVGFIAPKDTPEEIKSILHDTIKDIIDIPEVNEVMVNQILTNSYEDTETFQSIIEEASESNKKIMEEFGLLK